MTISITTGNTVDDPAERQSPAVAARIAIAREAAGERASSRDLSLTVDLVVTDHRRGDTDVLDRSCRTMVPRDGNGPLTSMVVL